MSKEQKAFWAFSSLFLPRWGNKLVEILLMVIEPG